MKKIIAILLICCTLIISVAAISVKQEPEINYVPNEATAIRVAEAVWIGLWGQERVDNEKPFHAKLENGIWYVSGTMPEAATKGGTIHMQLQASDCKILKVWGEK